jgi:hypothetical protein
MIGWFKKKAQSPSNYELGSRVASVIDGFISMEGVEEFSSPRLSVIIDDQYQVSIGERAIGGAPLVSIPLNELKLELVAVRDGPDMRHVAVDAAALLVMRRLSEKR